MSVFFHNPDNRVEVDLFVRRDHTLLWSPSSRPARFEAREHHFGEVTHIARWARETLGLDVAVLRALPDHEDGRLVHRAYEVEHLRGDPPSGWTWAADWPASLDSLTGERALAILAPPPAERRAWARPGWYEDTVGWLEASLPAPVRVGQRRNWERSSVLRVTAGGRVYFAKTPARALTHEGPLTAALHARLESRFPEVVALREDGTFVLRELPPGLERTPDQEGWEEALAAYAQTQRALAVDLPGALPARPPQNALANLEGSVKAAGDRLPPDHRERLVALRPSFETALERVLDLSLPVSWDHGDFWAGNVTQGGVFFDLSDGSATHPFFSLPWFLDTLPEGLDAGRLLDAYLYEWADIAPLERLRDAYRASAPLAHLHAADFYALMLLPSLEAQWEMVNMLPYYLGRAISAAPG